MPYKNIISLLPQRYKKSLVLIIFLMLLSMFMETLSIGLIIPAISLLTDPQALLSSEWLTSNLPAVANVSETEFVIYGLLALVLVYLLKALFLSYYYWKQNSFSYSLCMSLSEELYFGYLKAPWSFHVENNSAYLLRNISSEVNIFINNVIIPLLRLVTESLVVLGIGTLLLVIEPLGSLLVIVVMGLTGIGFHKITRARVVRWGEQRIEHEGRKILQLQQGLSAVKDIKVLGRETNFLKLFQPHNIKSATSLKYKLFLQQLPRLFLEVIAIAGLAMLVIISLFRGQTFAALLPLIGLFAAAVFRLMPSVNRIIEALQNLHYGLSSVTMIHSQLHFVRQLKKDDPDIKVEFKSKLEFRQVTFSYPGTKKPILDEASLEISKGETVGLIGTSGAGKTTLVDLLLGLLAPTSGEILSDGQDISKSTSGWQRNLGYVQQSICLLDDSLLNNIAFGLEESEIDMMRIDDAVKAAQLDLLVATLPKGLHTNIGEKGVKLSGGQRQRIGIARALYREPEILVFDEATSALDSDTEERIMDAIYELGKRKTIIIIAHRLTTVARCNRIYRLESGNLQVDDSVKEALSSK